MSCYYAFNGDADGLCALQQLRLAAPRGIAPAAPVTLVTGVKRDIQLLRRIDAGPGDEVTVLDVSLDSNRADLLRLLDSGARVHYFDHHYAGDLPLHTGFTPHIDESPEVCTSLLVDRHLGGRYRAWAIVATFGDALAKVGHALASGFKADEVAILRQLGTYLNYNAYGETVADLHFDPADLAAQMLPFAEPLDFVRHSPAYAQLAAGYHSDMAQARQLAPIRQLPGATLMLLPDACWARRVTGVFANELRQAQPDHALAILSPKACGAFSVSVRVPNLSPVSAEAFCRTFDTGGGRKLAAGINHLPQADVERFIARFEERFGSGS
ncbi:MAG: DHH family phosphoesterase [Pseudomonadota bacterium]